MRLDVVLSVVIVVVALAAAWWFRPTMPAPPVTATTIESVPPIDPSIVVHVSGAVSRPGLVSVPHSARVADAVSAAGGATSDADLTRINLAAPVTDGQQIVVPAAGSDQPSAAAGDGLVRINQATAADLEALPGVGPVLAERIIAHRDEVGGFQVVEDLLDVTGIGEAKLASLRDHIVVP